MRTSTSTSRTSGSPGGSRSRAPRGARALGRHARLPRSRADRGGGRRARGCLLARLSPLRVSDRSPRSHRGSRLAVAWAHLEEEPPRSERRPELPEALDAVIRKAMAKEPEDRYSTCGALIAAAEEALGLRRSPLSCNDARPCSSSSRSSSLPRCRRDCGRRCDRRSIQVGCHSSQARTRSPGSIQRPTR